MSSISRAATSLIKGMHTSNQTRIITPAARCGEQISKVASKVLVTGATGRLGQTLVPELTSRNIKCISTSRSEPKSSEQVKMTFAESRDDYMRMIETHGIHAIVNAAAASSGELREMLPVNTEAPLRMAEAAKKMGIPFIQVSTTATQFKGLTEAKPYAFSKQLTELGLEDNEHARTARLDVLLGDDSKIDLSFLAGIGKFLPVALQIGGIDSTIQPTTYGAASKALASFVEVILGGGDHPKEINIAGHPVKMSEFIRMVGKTACELHVPIEALHSLAALVNEGSLTPEFLKLAVKSSESPIVFDTSYFEALHGSPIPTIEDMAMKVHETVTLSNVFDTVRRIISKAPKGRLLSAATEMLRSSNIRLT